MNKRKTQIYIYRGNGVKKKKADTKSTPQRKRCREAFKVYTLKCKQWLFLNSRV